MIIRLRTVPRSDGRCSVILTREPGDPLDPQVIRIAESQQEGVRALLAELLELIAELGDLIIRTDREFVTSKVDRENRAMVKLTVLSEPGWKLRVDPKPV